jgi:hypothetical protein
MNRVMDEDVSLRILADAVGVAVFDGSRQLAPIVNGLVLMFTLSEDGRLAACFVGGSKEDGSGGGGSGTD